MHLNGGETGLKHFFRSEEGFSDWIAGQTYLNNKLLFFLNSIYHDQTFVETGSKITAIMFNT